MTDKLHRHNESNSIKKIKNKIKKLNGPEGFLAFSWERDCFIRFNFKKANIKVLITLLIYKKASGDTTRQKTDVWIQLSRDILQFNLIKLSLLYSLTRCVWAANSCLLLVWLPLRLIQRITQYSRLKIYGRVVLCDLRIVPSKLWVLNMAQHIIVLPLMCFFKNK